MVQSFEFPFIEERWFYIAFASLLMSLILDRTLRHNARVHDSRLRDRSEVEALIFEVGAIEPRLSTGEITRPHEYDVKSKRIIQEVVRLREIGISAWTEYQVLQVDQLLVDFMKIEDLIIGAESCLADLEDYAVDALYKYETRHFDRLKDAIEESIRLLRDSQGSSKIDRDDQSETLRAQLKDLLEHIAGYRKYWAEGSAVIKGLITCGAVAVLVFLAMGLLPVLYLPNERWELTLFNWGFLGATGSVSGVLLSFYKSNLVEVGDTEGKHEVWHAAIGAILGFVAGILTYSMLKSGMIDGLIVPDFDSAGAVDKKLKDIALSIIWAVGGGFLFENVFDRLRTNLKFDSKKLE